MPYTTGIPTSGQSLGNSRPQVQGNFDYINTTLKINHYFNEANAGKHKFVDLVEGLPDPAPLVGTNTLFTKVSGVPLGELYFIRGGSADVIQLTNGTPVNAATGSAFLPGGMMMQWGMVTLNGSGTSTVNFSPTFSLAGLNSNPWNIQVTFANTTFTTVRCVGVSAYAFNSFSISSFAGANQDVFWMAIGPRT